MGRYDGFLALAEASPAHLAGVPIRARADYDYRRVVGPQRDNR